MLGLKRPTGFDELITTFGDPRKYILPDGRLSAAWENTHITRIHLPKPLPLAIDAGETPHQVTAITCHVLLANIAEECFEKIDELGLWPSLVSYGGGFAWRPQRGSSKLSTHAWGIAWDFDPEHNALGTAGSMDLGVVEVFQNYGFFWGGEFVHRPDPMHVQFCAGY